MKPLMNLQKKPLPQYKMNNKETRKMKTAFPYEWIFIIPAALIMSPIGTCFIVAFWKLNFIGALIVIALQFIAYLIVGLLSNWGE